MLCDRWRFGESLLADPVFFDLVLEGPQADTEQLGGFLAVVGDFDKRPSDHFFLNFFQRISEGDDHGPDVFPADLNLLR